VLSVALIIMLRLELQDPWSGIADCLRGPALELASFKRQLKTFLFARY